jgi:hypothetical protein
MVFIKQSSKESFWLSSIGKTIIVGFVLLVLLSSIVSSTGPPSTAKRFRTAALATNVDLACQNYRTEYGTLPSASENKRLVAALCGDNPHKIEFLSLKKTDLNPNGELIDSWKTPLRSIFLPGSKVQVISAGPDKIFGTQDDITNQ